MSKWLKMESADMPKYLDQLTTEWELWIPKCENDKWEFGPHDQGQDVAFPESITHTSLKQLFFPKRRPIATFDEQRKW